MARHRLDPSLVLAPRRQVLLLDTEIIWARLVTCPRLGHTWEHYREHRPTGEHCDRCAKRDLPCAPSFSSGRARTPDVVHAPRPAGHEQFMSVNYYLPLPVSPAEGPEVPETSNPREGLHIAKFAAPGHLSLQGHRDLDGGDLTTWAQWRNVIAATGTVVAEHGVVYTAREFIDFIESFSGAVRAEQHRAVQREARTDALAASRVEQCWLDPEGFSFTFTPFF